MAAANNPHCSNNYWEHILEGGLLEESDWNSNLTICPDHEAVQNLFCNRCVQGVCYQCIIENHNGHPLDYYNAATARGLAVRNALSWEMKGTITDLTIGKRRVSLLQNSMDRNVETAKKDIKSFMKKCHTALDKREQYLLRTLNLAYNEKKSLMAQKQNEIDEHLESLQKSHDKLYDRSSMEDPITQESINSEALQELTASKELSLTPTCSDRIRFWKDFSMKLRIRHYLGILEVGDDLVLRREEDCGYCSPPVSDSEVD